MSNKIKVKVENLNLYYGENHALKDVNMDIQENAVTAFIGPSGCGKSTFLKTLNRMNDLVDGVRIDGKVLLDGEDIYEPGVDTTILRKKVGMVFQQPNPFPMSIYDNIAYGPRVHGIRDKKRLDQIVEESLRGAAIFDEVKDRLKKSAMGLSGGQQQRICIARALAVQPEVLLMDEPTSALDPISTAKIEELMEDLKKKYTVIVVTHNMQQAIGSVQAQKMSVLTAEPDFGLPEIRSGWGRQHKNNARNRSVTRVISFPVPVISRRAAAPSRAAGVCRPRRSGSPRRPPANGSSRSVRPPPPCGRRSWPGSRCRPAGRASRR